MPVVYNDELKRARLDAVTEAIDDGTDEGYIEIGTGTVTPWAFTTKLVEIDLEDPSFAAATTVATTTSMALGTPAGGLSGIAVDNGTAAVARICDSDDNVVVSGLVVGTAIGPGVEIALSAVAISSGQTVTITQGTITHS